jgi:hypothetical protein
MLVLSPDMLSSTLLEKQKIRSNPNKTESYAGYAGIHVSQCSAFKETVSRKIIHISYLLVCRVTM